MNPSRFLDEPRDPQANASLRSALSLTTEAPSVTLPDAKEMDPIDAEFHRHVERMGGGQ